MNKQDLLFSQVLSKLGNNVSNATLEKIESLITAGRSLKDIIKAVK